VGRTPLLAQRPVGENKSDIGLICSIILLLGLGLVTLHVSSANSALRLFNDELHFLKRQMVSISIGLVFCAFCAYVNFDFLRKCLPFIVIGSFVLCLLTFFPGIGVERNGAKRWIRLPFINTFQPSEAAKIAVVLFLANLFEKKKDFLDDAKKTIYPAAIGLCAFVIIVFFQDDFSSAMFIGLIGITMFFIAGIKIKWFFLFLLFALPTAVLFIFTKEYRVLRLIAFLRPEYDLQGLNYQIFTAKNTISSGGFFGKGLGGVELVNKIPEVQADFIFAGWVEAMGFLGVILYMIILGYFIYKSLRIAMECEDLFRSFVAYGCTMIIALQSFMNCGVVCGALPSTGIPLPFFSSGGSSMIITLGICGLLINVSKNKSVNGEIYE
jgi:cell division protein FtsW